VPDHTSTKEIFEGYAPLIRCDHVDVDTNMAREMPCPSDQHLAQILANLYDDREYLNSVADACYQRVTDPQFSWDSVASQFGGVFQEVMEGGEPEVEEKPKKKKKEKKEKRTVGAAA
jgi:hypothetical protein